MEDEAKTPCNAGRKKPTVKEKDIITAAVRLFSQYGYTGTTTMAIAQEAKVSEKTLFKYFHTKQELYDKAVYPLMQKLIRDKVEGYTNHGSEGIYHLLQDIYREKIHLVNEHPEILKLTVHEFLMNPKLQGRLSEVWNVSYLPYILQELHLSDAVKDQYGEALNGGLTRFMVCLLFAYAMDKTYLRPEQTFDDEKEIELMLNLLFNGMNGLQDCGVKEKP